MWWLLAGRRSEELVGSAAVLLGRRRVGCASVLVLRRRQRAGLASVLVLRRVEGCLAVLVLSLLCSVCSVVLVQEGVLVVKRRAEAQSLAVWLLR